MFNVQIVSRETIKPSSPTPQNLRYLQLSLAAQVFAPAHVPYIIYYSGNDTTGKSIRLKKSLSDVLTRFYPLAGRIKQEDDDPSLAYTHVECNDTGVELYEARVKGSLSEFLRQPLTEEPSPLLPHAAVSTIVPLVIQFNVFDCGGSAMGFFLSHMVADGTSFVMFLKSWAEATRGDFHKVVSPTFEFASVFPPRRAAKNRWMQQEPTMPPSEKKVMAMKELVFESAKIALLRQRVFERVGFFPTRVEVVSALIWRCKMRSLGEEDRKPVAMHAVSIRRRMEPPLPQYSFGNLVVPAFTTGKKLYGMGYFEERLRESIGKMKSDHIRQLLEKDVEKGVHESIWNLDTDEWGKRGFDLFVFTIMGNFYESDFGWGKPEKYCVGSIQPKNAVILLPTRDGEGGMEALLFLEKGEMKKFEQDPELLAFASIKNQEETSGKTTLILGRL